MMPAGDRRADNSARLLPELLRLGREIHALAEDGRWDQVRTAEMRRRELIEACFPLDGSIADRPQAAAWLQEIVRLGNRVTELATAARLELGGKVSQLKRGRRAAHRYQEMSRH